MVLKTQRYTGRVAQGLPSLRSRFAASQLKPVLKGLLIPAVALAPFALTLAACGGETTGAPDKNGGHLADGIGSLTDANRDGMYDSRGK